MARKADPIVPEPAEDEEDFEVEEAWEGLVPAFGVASDPEFDRVVNFSD